jgi:hypothetical protein
MTPIPRGRLMSVLLWCNTDRYVQPGRGFVGGSDRPAELLPIGVGYPAHTIRIERVSEKNADAEKYR